MYVSIICQGKLSKVVYKLNRFYPSPGRCIILFDAKPVLGPLLSLIYSYFIGEIFPKVKVPEREGNHLSLPSAEIRKHAALSPLLLCTCNT